MDASVGADDLDTSRGGFGRPGRVHTDMWVAAAVVAICVATFLGTLTFPEVPAALAQGMGPGLFPQLVLGVIVLLAGWLALSARSRPDPEREPVHRMVVLTVVAGVLFVPVLIYFGMYGAIAFAILGLGRLWGERRWAVLIAVAVGMSAVIYLVFVKAFGIGLPRSLIWLWLT